MNNYQLYSTNSLLGGQMKWDLVINSSQNSLYVSDFHLTPISNNTPYTYKTDEYLIKNKHQDNVKTFYNNTREYFYKDCLDSTFSHIYPTICKSGEKLNTYSNIYDMGCKRSKQYSRYNKQFEFFCPLWIEHLYDVLSFKIIVKTENSDIRLSSNTLSLSPNNIKNKFHNKFVQYFNAYISDAGLDVGNDDILNIQFDDNHASISGLNVSTGVLSSRDINYLVENITHRERPLMEVDDMIIQSFVKNTIVCKQLFNFNLCFDINDILSGSLVEMINGDNLIVSVEVMIGDTVLETKNFYTEYEYIDKCITSDKKTDVKMNVLDYLHDYEYIEFIDKNKFNQSICHWSLCDNADYIFNVYDGFAGINIEHDVNNTQYFYENEHQYCNSPNTSLNQVNKNQNSTGWITTYEIQYWDEFYKYVRNTNANKTVGTIIGDYHFINNVRYKYVPNLDTPVYVIGLSMSDSLLKTIHISYNKRMHPLTENSDLYLMCIDDLMLLLTNDINNFTFNRFYNTIVDLFDNDDNKWLVDKLKLNNFVFTFVSELRKMLANKVDPSIVVFDKSLLYTSAHGPNVDISEVEYYKDNKAYNYVVRYGGKIKPSFTDNINTLYYKDYISDDGNDSKLAHSVYTSIDNYLYEPKYPSIDFCAIKKINDWTYSTLPQVMVSEHDNTVGIYGDVQEYSWFNNSKCKILVPEFDFTFVNRKVDGYKSLDDIINDGIKDFYDIDDDNIIDFIRQKYECTNNWDYYSDTNIFDYIYHISYKLK